ncbi:DUF4190 domain-containing protein [Promicromonospora aerolata]|uniref:DUF4190 domain-containing protein n=1 Tax=Promicromonospora aerolata TaxID=195749 RepID=A0ABW4V304_9MICO
MTENEGGTPRDPQRDPETPPTQPVPDSSLDAEQPPGTPANPTSNEPSGQPGAQSPYGLPGAPATYGQPGAPAAQQYGYVPAPPKNDLAVWSLITGILSYVFCPLVLGIAAIITGTMSRRAADEGLANNRGMGTAGLILGWINVVLVVLGIVFVIIAIAAGLFAGGIGGFYEMNDMNRMTDY